MQGKTIYMKKDKVIWNSDLELRNSKGKKTSWTKARMKNAKKKFRQARRLFERNTLEKIIEK